MLSVEVGAVRFLVHSLLFVANQDAVVLKFGDPDPKQMVFIGHRVLYLPECLLLYGQLQFTMRICTVPVAGISLALHYGRHSEGPVASRVHHVPVIATA